MKKAKYLLFIFIIFFVGLNIVKAKCGDLIYEITKLNISDDKIVFEGWSFVHFTNNSRETKVYGSNRYGGGQEVIIVAENTSNGEKIYLDNMLYDGYSGSNATKLKKYNFYYMQFFDRRNADVEKEYTTNYNHLTGRYDSNSCNFKDHTCGAEECHQCLFEDIGFHIELEFSKLNLSDSSEYKFYIYATNNDYNDKYNRKICYGTDNLKGKKSAIYYDNKYWTGSEIYIADSVKKGSSNKVKINSSSISKDKVYVTVEHGLPRVLNNYGGYSTIGNYISNDEYVFRERLEDYDCIYQYKCGPGDYVINVNRNGTAPGDDKTAKIYRSWALPSGSTTLTINFVVTKKCPVDNEASKKLSCNNTTSVTGECSQLTVSNGNEMTTVSIKQTGTIANLLSPKEIYNGGGIKFGILYYNKIQFDYVSGSRNINIRDIMNSRIKGTEDIKLENIKIGNINVSDTYIKKTCEQIKNDNSVETICLFHFTPQLVNEDGSIVKDDIDASYDLGINNKYYLPLEYRSVYRVSGDLVNASFLDKNAAIGDSKNNKPWYGTKWEKISLSDDGTCDINVYKLGPGSDEIIDNKIIYKFIYRPIDLKNPFPRNRIIGLNWNLWYTNDSNRYRLEHSYDNLEYDIELNNIIINKIKKYNSSNDYFDFDYDNFIKDIGLKVGGN